jgi:hypothetical protein
LKDRVTYLCDFRDFLSHTLENVATLIEENIKKNDQKKEHSYENIIHSLQQAKKTNQNLENEI